MGMVHLPLFDTITLALPERTLADTDGPAIASGDGEFIDDPAPREAHQVPPRVSSLVGFLESYARLTIYDADVLAQLCDALVKRRDELVSHLVVRAARAAAALSFPHTGLIDVARTCLANWSEDLPVEDFQTLERSLLDLS